MRCEIKKMLQVDTRRLRLKMRVQSQLLSMRFEIR